MAKKELHLNNSFRNSCCHCAFWFYWINLKLIFFFNNFPNLKWSVTKALDWILSAVGCWILLRLPALAAPPRVRKFCFMHRTKRPGDWLPLTVITAPPDHLHHLALSCAKQPRTSGSNTCQRDLLLPPLLIRPRFKHHTLARPGLKKKKSSIFSLSSLLLIFLHESKWGSPLQNRQLFQSTEHFSHLATRSLPPPPPHTHTVSV